MLRVENICKTFFAGTINEKKALQGLSLHLKPGDFVEFYCRSFSNRQWKDHY